MRLDDLEAKKIIVVTLGNRGELKSDDELAQILKRRLTKKERFALNAKILNRPLKTVLHALNIDEARFEAIVATATKKIQNESLHKEFYQK